MEIWSKIDSRNIISELKSRLNELSKLPFNRLTELPEFSTENVRIDETEVIFTTYREIDKNSGVEIVVQAQVSRSKGLIFKRAQVSADGFRMTCRGETESLPMKFLYSYM
jgi:hypothetical protein